MSIAFAAPSASSYYQFLTRGTEITQERSGCIIIDRSPDRDTNWKRFGRFTGPFAALTGLAMIGLEVLLVMKVKQRVESRFGDKDHVSSPTAITPIRTAPGTILLAQKTDATATTVA